MAENGNGVSSFLGGVLVGSILGIVAGILFAPKAGRDLRDDLMKRGKEAVDEAQEKMSEMSEKGRDVMEQAKSKIGQMKEEAQGTQYR